MLPSVPPATVVVGQPPTRPSREVLLEVDQAPQYVWVFFEAYQHGVHRSGEEDTANKRRGQHKFLPQSLNDVRPFRMLTVIRSHGSSHALMGLADSRCHLLWYAEACEHQPQQLSRPTESHDFWTSMKHIHVRMHCTRGGGVYRSSSGLLQPAHNKQHADRGGQRPHCSTGSFPSASQ